MDQVILELEALRLPAHQRALLADALLGNFDDEAARGGEWLRAQESEDCLAAFHQGQIAAVDGPSALNDLRNRRTG